MQHIKDEGHALANGDEANHDGKDNRQKRDYLIQYSGHHVRGDDAAQRGSGSLSLKKHLLSFGAMVAGLGFKPRS